MFHPLRLLVGLVVLLALGGAGFALYRDDEPAAEKLSVGWNDTEDHAGCTYLPESGTVVAELTLDGTAVKSRTLTLTVTAYADENTSDAVGSSTRQVKVRGSVHRTVTFTIPVDRPPHVDEDAVASCSRVFE